MISALQAAQPFVVTIVQKPAPQTTLADVLLASLGVVGVSILAAAALGAVVAYLLVLWNRRHPPEADHLPPISPLVPDPGRPSSPTP